MSFRCLAGLSLLPCADGWYTYPAAHVAAMVAAVAAFGAANKILMAIAIFAGVAVVWALAARGRCLLAPIV